MKKNPKKRDLVSESCTNPVFVLLFVILLVSFILDEPFNRYLQVLFMFFISTVCFLNFRQCGRRHCQITGPGFLIVAIIALLNVLLLSISWSYVWALFFAVLVAGYGIEIFYKGKTGSCYK